MTFERIEDLRVDEDKTQEQTAKELYLHKEQYRRYEKGISPVSLEFAIRLAQKYNVSIDYIAGLTNDKGGLHCNVITKEERELLDLWKKINKENQKAIKTIIINLTKNNKI